MSNNIGSLCFHATGIGSVPFLDLDKTCAQIIELFPSLPFWPQLVKRSYVEDMIIQFTEGFPFISIDKEKRVPRIVTTDNIESMLLEFYDHFLADDFQYFAISNEFAPGLHRLLDMVEADGHGHGNGGYIKGQTVGPITLAAAITGPDGKSILHEPNLLEPLVHGLSIKAVWQAITLGKTGRQPIIFLDEPYLSGYGSAFSPIERSKVIEILEGVISYIKDRSNALVGIHCCGNTDWAMLLETSPHIINFDASDYMEYFLLYNDAITRYLKNGGVIAWGIVPTSSFQGHETVQLLFERLKSGIDTITKWGIDNELVCSHSLLTPACGLGSMEPAKAMDVLRLLADLSRKCRRDFIGKE